MTSRFRAEIEVDAGDRTRAIFESVAADDGFGPGGQAAISMDGPLAITIESDRLPQLRAALNSALRLVQAGHDAIESVKI